MKINFVLAAIGTALILGSIWGGSYFLSLYPHEHWANFPIFTSAVIAFFAGIGSIMASAN